MNCPKCKKNKSNILKEKFLENKTIRERNCPVCDFFFTTNEKIILLKKQKPRPNKLFMNYRFYLYGYFRLFTMFEARDRLIDKAGGLSKARKKYDAWILDKTKGGKNQVFIAEYKNTNKGKIQKKRFITKPLGKKESIELILSYPQYWIYKKSIFKNFNLDNSDIKTITENLLEKGLKDWKKNLHTQKEKLLIMKTSDEIEDFHKSVSHYLKKNEDEYNLEFFRNYKIDSKYSPFDANDIVFIKKYWNDKHNWSLFQHSK